MNNIHKLMLKFSQNIDPDAPLDMRRFSDAAEVFNLRYSEKTKKDFLFLKNLIQKFNSDKNDYVSKLNPNLVNYFNSLVESELPKAITFKAPLTSEGAKKILESGYDKVKNVLQKAFEKVSGLSGKSTEKLLPGWTVAQWEKILNALLNRAQSQLESAKAKAETSSDAKKKIYQSTITAKQTYVNMLNNLLKRLYDIVSKNNLGLNSEVSDSLLPGYSSESSHERQFPGGSEGRSRGGARSYTNEEGKSVEVTQETLLDFPLYIQNDELWIKELIEAYGLAGTYPLLVSSKAPEVLSFKTWTSSFWKRINEAMHETGLGEYEIAQYVNELRNAFIEMQEKYIEHMKSKGNRPNPKQLQNFGKLIGSLKAVAERFPYTSISEAKQEVKANTYQGWLNKQFTDGFDGFINKLKELGYTATGASKAIYKNDNKKIAIDTRDGKLYEFSNGEWKPTSNIIEHTVADL